MTEYQTLQLVMALYFFVPALGLILALYFWIVLQERDERRERER